MKDILSKKERVERTLNLQPVDRVPVHDHLINPAVVSFYTGREIAGFNYSLEDVSEATRKTMDMCRFPGVPCGTDRVVTDDGFVQQNDNWTSWVVKRPFNSSKGLKEYYSKAIDRMKKVSFDPDEVRQGHHEYFKNIQTLVGDTVIMDMCQAGLEACWTAAGIILFTFLYHDEPEVIQEWLRVFVDNEVKRVHAVADRSISPVVLVISDLATKGGPIFSPEFLRKEHFPHVARLVKAWQEHDIKTIYHSDGNWKILIDDFIKCGLDGFYCLEPAVGMDVVELKQKYPSLIWAGTLDGVELMERGSTEEVRKETRRQIEETDALRTGGFFMGTSSEINPPIKAENYSAMIEEAISIRNPDFY